MPYASRSSVVLSQLAAAIDAGLVAAATTYQAEMKKVLAPGYTSGAFVTGNLVNSIFTDGPVDENGVRVIRVACSATRNGAPYPLYWELGHQNLFTRKFEREPRWVPTLMEQIPVLQDRFVQAARAVFAGLDVTVTPSEAAD